MNTTLLLPRASVIALVALVALVAVPCAVRAEDKTEAGPASEIRSGWQDNAAEHARILSQVKWTPVAAGMPNRRGGFFENGQEYTGVPYSSVKSVGRYIGFDISLRTFLAAVENPQSVLYTENLSGEVSNAAAYYGAVCSSYTSYALGCGIPEVSRRYGPDISEGVTLVEPQAAQAVRVGDIIYTPPRPGSHVEMVTAVTTDESGRVVSVRVEESRPPTTTTTDRSAADFDAHLAARDRQLFRVTDPDAWRAGLADRRTRTGPPQGPEGYCDSTAPLATGRFVARRFNAGSRFRDNTIHARREVKSSSVLWSGAGGAGITRCADLCSRARTCFISSR